MAFDEELIRGMSAIYKYVYENPNVHRNILRKQMINKGKISSKEKFSKTLQSLIALGKLTQNGEYVSINPKIVTLGVLQRDHRNFYVVTPNTKKHLSVDSRVAYGYKCGDVLDLIVEYSGKDNRVVILGKSNKQFENHEVKKPKAIRDAKIQNIPSENLVLGRVVKLSHDDLIFIPNKKAFQQDVFQF